ncbi:MAG: nitrite reductase (NAD(P)H) small subunit [Ignavibacteriales bacterium]|nr:nitrite reductase (NAD(P)H) small subunit [Ignavibacteriales bacterium]
MKPPEGFLKVCKASDLKEKIGQRFFVDDVDVAVFRIGEEVFALSNVCIHQKAAIIYDGYVEDECVYCPAHGWMFNLRTGKFPGGLKGLDSYEVQILEGDVYVKVFKREFKW